MVKDTASNGYLKSQNLALNLIKTSSKIAKTANAAKKKWIKREIKKTDMKEKRCIKKKIEKADIKEKKWIKKVDINTKKALAKEIRNAKAVAKTIQKIEKKAVKNL